MIKIISQQVIQLIAKIINKCLLKGTFLNCAKLQKLLFLYINLKMALIVIIGLYQFDHFIQNF